MANIDTYLNSILNDSYGEDVRSSIKLALSAITDEAMLYGLTFKEALTALLPGIEANLDKFVVPEGTLEITQPGTYDVTEYDYAAINVSSNEAAITAIEEGLEEVQYND